MDLLVLADHLIAFSSSRFGTACNDRKRGLESGWRTVEKKRFLPFQESGRLWENKETFGPQNDKYWILIYKTHKKCLRGKGHKALDWLFGIRRNAAKILIEECSMPMFGKIKSANRRRSCERLTFAEWFSEPLRSGYPERSPDNGESPPVRSPDYLHLVQVERWRLACLEVLRRSLRLIRLLRRHLQTSLHERGWH